MAGRPNRWGCDPGGDACRIHYLPLITEQRCARGSTRSARAAAGRRAACSPAVCTRLDCLARNLVTAGALERAVQYGIVVGVDAVECCGSGPRCGRADVRRPSFEEVAGGEALERLARLLAAATPTCTEAVSTFGRHAQEDMAIEEMAELTVAVLHRGRSRCTDAEVQEEIADVLILMWQLAIEYGVAQVTEVMLRKLVRLRDRIRAKREDGSAL